MSGEKVPCAILGSGNIGTDLMYKLQRSRTLEPRVMVGIDPESDGLKRARREGLVTTHEGVDWIVSHPEECRFVFEATSAGAHRANAPKLAAAGLQSIDLTPAKLGPGVVPAVNIEEHWEAADVNMITCGGQATIPMVYAVRRAIDHLPYAEMVSTVSSKSAGPGTRQNIDEFTRTTAKALEEIGGAEKGKAIIILNPAEPPLIMRDTVYTLSQGGSQEAIEASINEMVKEVQAYVPGYRLKQKVQFEHIGDNMPVRIPGIGAVSGLKTTVFLEVEGAAHYLPAYAGNLDIMTSAALVTADHWAARERAKEAA